MSSFSLCVAVFIWNDFIHTWAINSHTHLPSHTGIRRPSLVLREGGRACPTQTGLTLMVLGGATGKKGVGWYKLSRRLSACLLPPCQDQQPSLFLSAALVSIFFLLTIIIWVLRIQKKWQFQEKTWSTHTFQWRACTLTHNWVQQMSWCHERRHEKSYEEVEKVKYCTAVKQWVMFFVCNTCMELGL